MKKIIISLDSYSWIKYCIGLILENSSEFSVMLLYKERGDKGMLMCDSLCMTAVAAQRRHDVARIGRKLGVKRIINLNYEDFLDVDHLSMNLKLESTFGNVKELYYPYNEVLSLILEEIGESIGVNTYCFGDTIDEPEKKLIDTTKYENIINEVKQSMIGISSLKQLDFPIIEKFY